MTDATHYVQLQGDGTPRVMDAELFEAQGGLTNTLGTGWQPIEATSTGDARRKAAKLFNVNLPNIP